MSEANKALARRFFESYSKLQRLPVEILAQGFHYHPAGAAPLDLEQTRQRMAAIEVAFSELRYRIESLVAEGDLVAYRGSITMKHTQPYMGMAANGKQVNVVEMGFMRVEDGSIVEMWGLLDIMALMYQLGGFPPRRPGGKV